MFESLSDRLKSVFNKLSGKGKLTEEDVDLGLREVRQALLEADVNFKVAKDFVARVRERAIGVEVLESLTPAQQVIKIVNEGLVELLGGGDPKLLLTKTPPNVIMMVGLQGSGKTTTCAKLALYLRKQGQRPLLVAADTYRPAAVDQLVTLGKQLNIPVFEEGTTVDPVEIVRDSLQKAKDTAYTVVIADTAGRLHINEELMAELERIKEISTPSEVLLVADAMTGQDAVRAADEFNQKLGLTGLVLTKMDGDARGGAALSIRSVTGVPIKFIGTGEKADALEFFHPDRVASRILGMGDMLTLIEKAQVDFDEKKAEELQKKVRNNQLTLEDFLEQMQQVKKMGPLDQIMDMIPGLGGAMRAQQTTLSDKEMKRVEAIIRSMTPEERRNPEIIKGSRRRRIAVGSGTSVQDVNMLLNQFKQMQGIMKRFSKGKIPKSMQNMFQQ
jgi:signal recognition particle subunit SRP54